MDRLAPWFTGKYLFHLHTCCTDGEPTVGQYFARAQRLGAERLVFLEHIRACPTYDVPAFAQEVRDWSARTGLPAGVGFEARVLPGGGLDIDEAHAALADVVGIAEHGFPDDVELLLDSLAASFQRCGDRQTTVWVHPGRFLQRHGLLAGRQDDYLELLDTASASGVWIECNARYALLPPALIPQADEKALVVGLDAHRLDEVLPWWERPIGA